MSGWTNSLSRRTRFLPLVLVLLVNSYRPAFAQLQWSTWAGLSGGITRLATAVNPTGRVEVFAIGTDQALNHIWQTTPGGGVNHTAWSNWSGLGGGITEIATAVNQDGRLEVFAIGTDAALNHIWQTAIDGGANHNSWSSWQRLAGGITHIAAAVNQDGRIEVFAVGTDQALNHIWQTVPNGGPNRTSWSSWAGLVGGITQIATAVNQDGRIEVFAVGTDQALNHIWQTAPNGGPNRTSWSNWAGLAGGITQIATAVNQDARIEVFAVGTDQALNHIWQTAPNGGPNRTSWSNWAGLAGGITKLATAANFDGRVEVFAIGIDQALNHIWQRALNGGPSHTSWSSWAGLAGGITKLATAANFDGRIEVFAIGIDQALNHIWQSEPGAGFQIAVSTYHYDNLRTGWNESEMKLTPASVSGSLFGLLATPTSVDEQVDAQPLLVPNQLIAGQASAYDVVYVATENNSIYAIDASSGAVLNSNNFGNPVPREYLTMWKVPHPPGGGCSNDGPFVGINGTPVIDLANNTMYLITYTISGISPNFQAGTQTYQIHAIDLTTLKDKIPPKPVEASHTLSDGSPVTFSAVHQRQRAALVEANGAVYAGFGAFCDDEFGDPADPDHARGWLLGWKAGTLEALPSNQLNDTDANAAANSRPFFLSSIWMSGFGISSDESGQLFFTTGNSDCTADYPCTSGYQTTYDGGVHNVQESVVKIGPDLSKLTDHFTPSNVSTLDQQDNDFSAGGVLLMPLQPLTTPHLAAAAGKDGRMFLLNRDALGGFTPGGPDKVLDVQNIGACWCGLSYFEDSVSSHIVSSGGTSLGLWGVKPSPPSLANEGFFPDMGPQQDGGFFTSVSSHGAQDAILWAVSRPQDSTDAVRLYAFSLSPSLTPLFKSPPVAGYWPNTGANANIVPVVANGKVYVASNKQLFIFGLTSTTSPAIVAAAPVHAKIGVLNATDHHIYGTIRSVTDSAMMLQTRDGKTIQVDLAAARGRRANLKEGHAVQVWGTRDTAGVLHATMVYRAKPVVAIWPPDL